MKARCRGASATALVALAATLISAGTAGEAAAVTPLGEDWQRGAVSPGYSARAYLEPGADRALKALAATGSTHVNLYVEWFMRGSRASRVRPERGRTPSDRSLLHAMRKARSLGMTPVITLVVRSKDGVWQALIDPRDRAAWYESYRRMTRHYARVARQGRAGMMVLGAELESMAWQTARWRRVIRDAREIFSGDLTYSANAIGGAERVGFWPKLDYIGISAYMKLRAEANPSVRKLVSAWRNRGRVRGVRKVHRRNDRPVIFTEIGYGSGMYTAQAPWKPAPGPTSQEPQRRAYEAFYRVWSEQRWFRGVYWWLWWPGRYDPGDRSHSPRGKAAEDVMRRWNYAR